MEGNKHQTIFNLKFVLLNILTISYKCIFPDQVKWLHKPNNKTKLAYIVRIPTRQPEHRPARAPKRPLPVCVWLQQAVFCWCSNSFCCLTPSRPFVVPGSILYFFQTFNGVLAVFCASLWRFCELFSSQLVVRFVQSSDTCIVRGQSRGHRLTSVSLCLVFCTLVILS